MSYGGRLEADPRVSVVGNSSYSVQPAPSILGAAPQRNVDDLVYAQASSNPGYGVSLPPGRDYGIGKGLHGTSLESDFPGSLSSRSGLSRVEDQKDDRYARELDLREEERRRERLRDRERERERERDRERERERERRRLLEIREKERERDRERKRALESRLERTPPRASKDRRGTSLTKDGKSSRRDSPRREALHRWSRCLNLSFSSSLFIAARISCSFVTNLLFYYAEGFIRPLKKKGENMSAR